MCVGGREVEVFTIHMVSNAHGEEYFRIWAVLIFDVLGYFVLPSYVVGDGDVEVIFFVGGVEKPSGHGIDFGSGGSWGVRDFSFLVW